MINVGVIVWSLKQYTWEAVKISRAREEETIIVLIIVVLNEDSFRTVTVFKLESGTSF